MNTEMVEALARGSVALTPNRRLARHLHLEYAMAQRASGASAWETPRILPWDAWLEALWWDAVEVLPGALPQLLSPAQAGHAWERVVTQDRSLDAALFDRRGAAATASTAWTLMHAWGSGGASWRGWIEAGAAAEEAVSFARWCASFLRMMDARGTIEMARLPDRLSPSLGALHARLPSSLWLAGFVELSPQQQRLLDSLTFYGVAVRSVAAAAPVPAQVERRLVATPQEEIAAALRWARDRLTRFPQSRVGIAIESLAARRSEVVALATEILSPRDWLAGAEQAAGAFNVSLGLPLADVPIVNTALDLIDLAAHPMPMGRAAGLLRSPYLEAASSEWTQRARIEADWLHAGRHEAAFSDALLALTATSPGLAARWREAQAILRSGRGSRSPPQWTDAWQQRLAALGWPGERTLSSDEFQARQAWQNLLASFGSLEAVSPALSSAQAADALRGLARNTLFQPESSDAPIQILGLLEASGMSFDALWVCGLTADAWPPAPAPNPFLPIHWQRAHRVPRSSAERELAYAEVMTRGFAGAAAQVVFSSAVREGEATVQPSALIEAQVLTTAPILAEQADAEYTGLIATSTTLEAVVDDRVHARLPPVLAGGGAGLIAAQADCPFQALGRFRLKADPWPALSEGLELRERGSLAHQALAHFWQQEREQAALIAMRPDERRRRVEAAVDHALASLPPARWRNLPEIVHSGERTRLVAQVQAWLEVDAARPRFSIDAIEEKVALQLGGLTLGLRVDRVDRAASGALVLIDYKTGNAPKVPQWFETRPRAPQLGLYALAWRERVPEMALAGAAYAQLCVGEVKAIGLADRAVWPDLVPLGSKTVPATWQEVEEAWRERLSAIANEIVEGLATVAPRDTGACRLCQRFALCRVRCVAAPEASDDAAEPIDG